MRFNDRLKASYLLELGYSVWYPALAARHIRDAVHLLVAWLVIDKLFYSYLGSVRVSQSHKSACVVGMNVGYDVSRDDRLFGVALHLLERIDDKLTRVSSAVCVVSEACVNYYKASVGELNHVAHSVFRGARDLLETELNEFGCGIGLCVDVFGLKSGETKGASWVNNDLYNALRLKEHNVDYLVLRYVCCKFICVKRFVLCIEGVARFFKRGKVLCVDSRVCRARDVYLGAVSRVASLSFPRAACFREVGKCSGVLEG